MMICIYLWLLLFVEEVIEPRETILCKRRGTQSAIKLKCLVYITPRAVIFGFTDRAIVCPSTRNWWVDKVFAQFNCTTRYILTWTEEVDTLPYYMKPVSRVVGEWLHNRRYSWSSSLYMMCLTYHSRPWWRSSRPLRRADRYISDH